MSNEEYNEKYIDLVNTSPKVSIIGASPYVFSKIIKAFDKETLEQIKELYDFVLKNNKELKDPFVYINQQLLNDHLTTIIVFDTIDVIGDKTLFCKN